MTTQHDTDERERGARADGPEPSPNDPTLPWWVGFGPIGAVVLIVLGVAFSVWLSLGLPGANGDDQPQHYYSAGKLVSVGVVVGGSALLRRLCARARGPREERDDDGDVRDEREDPEDRDEPEETDPSNGPGTARRAPGHG